LSPLLSNIYLNRLDKYVETTLLPFHNRGDRRRPYLPYMRLHKAVWKLERKGQREGTRQMRQHLQQLPARDPNDPDFRRLRYIRYADDWLLGFTGTRREAEGIKATLINGAVAFEDGEATGTYAGTVLKGRLAS